MWSEFLKVAEKWQFPGIAGLGGLAFLYLSFFTGLPSPQNNWAPLLRPSPHWGLLALGLVLIAGAATLVVASIWKQADGKAAAQVRAAKLRSVRNLSESNDDEEAQPHPVVLKYWKLPKTQKEILTLFYEHSHRDHLPLDTLFKALVDRHGRDFIKSEDELFYRLKALRVDGFLGLGAVAQKETDVVKLDAVRKALSDADIINT